MRSKRRNGEATSGSENFSLLFSLLALLKDKNEKTRERERERLADSSSHLHAMYRTFLPSLPLSLNSPNQKMNSTRAKPGYCATLCSNFERDGGVDFCAPRSSGGLGTHAMFGNETGGLYGGHVVCS